MSDTSERVNYVEPSEFFNETLKCLKNGEISNELGSMFLLLGERIVNHRHFVRYTHLRGDLISVCVHACCRAYDKFRPDRNILTRDEDGNIIKTEPVVWDGEMIEYDHKKHYNPHAFFTTVSFNALKQYLKQEYSHRNAINELKLDNGLDADYGYVEMMKERESAQKKREEKTREKKETEERMGGIVW